MEKILFSPGKYIQGSNALDKIALYAKKKSLILCDEFITEMLHPIISSSFNNNQIECTFELFTGECTIDEVNRCVDIINNNQFELIIGVGGGKTLDTAKAISHYSNIPVMIVPTVASTDAPCTALAVLYKNDGSFDKYLFLEESPKIVLVDSNIIAKAPPRLLAAGMGDALATYFEARTCYNANQKNLINGTSTIAAMTLAKLCYDTLISDGKKAYIGALSQSNTKALENIIETNTYLSGIGAESAGLGAAHSIHNGLTIMKECHHLYHGEKVAFGTIVQLFLENAPLSEIDEVIAFCKSVNLPTNLKEMGINTINIDDLFAVSKAACAPGETIHNSTFVITPELVLASILTANEYCSN